MSLSGKGFAMSSMTKKLVLVVFCALIAGGAAGLQGSAYLGCAEGCNGPYCWGSTAGSKGCMGAAFGTCVLFYTKLCPA